MDPEIVCITKHESLDFIESHFDVDSVSSKSSSSTALPSHDIFSVNSNVSSTTLMKHSETQVTSSREECLAGSQQMELADHLDQTTPSPNELLNTYNSGINLILDNEELWSKFREVHTEMIITKSGRRMFPSFCLSAIGLNMDVKYAMKLVFKSDDKRYKYVNSKWAVSGKAESHIDEFLSYKHPDSNSTGKSWTYNKISFKKVKLTNSKTPKKGQISLNSMHKYIPCVVVSKFISKKNAEIVHIQEFPQAAFFAVTAYQNDQVTQLKIDNNPFAKAFRESPVDKEISSVFGLPQTGWTNGVSSLTTRWPLPSPLLSPSCSPISPLINPRWPPTSPIINPFNGEFTQVTFSPVNPTGITGNSPLPQFTSVFGTSSNPYAIYRPPSLSLPTYSQPPYSTSGIITNQTQ